MKKKRGRPRANIKSVKLTVSITPRQEAELRRWALEEDRSVSWMVRYFMELGLTVQQHRESQDGPVSSEPGAD